MSKQKESINAWVVRRYKVLWTAFGERKFTFEDAVKTLGEEEKFVSVFLSELKKLDWIEVELNQEDSRKRIYKLRSLEEVAAKFLKRNFDDTAKGFKVNVE